MPSGLLTIAGTPIGNLADASPRLVSAMSSATLVACEDTRRTGQLYQLLGLKAPKLVSYHKDNESARSTELVQLLTSGQPVLMVSDSGMPGLSDPGAMLVAAARAAGVRVEVIPGPSAVAVAVGGSGFAGPFVFYGFLPRKGRERKELITRLMYQRETTVLFEAPTRVAATVTELAEIFGDRPAWLARELTKLHEEWLGPDLVTLRDRLAAQPVRGECTLVIQGAQSDFAPMGLPLSDHDIETEIKTRLKKGETARQVAGWLTGQGDYTSSTAYAHVQNIRKLQD